MILNQTFSGKELLKLTPAVQGGAAGLTSLAGGQVQSWKYVYKRRKLHMGNEGFYFLLFNNNYRDSHGKSCTY